MVCRWVMLQRGNIQTALRAESEQQAPHHWPPLPQLPSSLSALDSCIPLGKSLLKSTTQLSCIHMAYTLFSARLLSRNNTSWSFTPHPYIGKLLMLQSQNSTHSFGWDLIDLSRPLMPDRHPGCFQFWLLQTTRHQIPCVDILAHRAGYLQEVLRKVCVC